jgi:hypothetical protein
VIEDDAEAAAKRFTEANRIALFDGDLERPVEILFIDGAKSWLGICHLGRTLADSLIPEKTLLVCQDFKYWGTYWVPMFMMAVGDYVAPVHDVLGSTTVSFMVTKPIPAEVLSVLPNHVADLDRDSVLRQIDAAADLLHTLGDLGGANNVRLAQVSFLAHKGDKEAAVHAFRQIERQWPAQVPTAQLERARTYLRGEKKANLPRPLRLRARSAFRRLKAVLR